VVTRAWHAEAGMHRYLRRCRNLCRQQPYGMGESLPNDSSRRARRMGNPRHEGTLTGSRDRRATAPAAFTRPT
jgi:hypothetical protein